MINYLFLRYRNKSEEKLKNKIYKDWCNPRYNTYYDFNEISSYYEYCINKESFLNIDDIIVNDLDLNELFVYIDRTSSKIGQQYLYYRLRNISNDNDLIQKYSNFFTSNSSKRIFIQVLLNNLNSRKSYKLHHLFSDTYYIPSFAKYFIYSLILVLFILFFSLLYKPLLILLIPLFFLNSIFHYKNKKFIKYFNEGINQMIIANEISKQISAVDKIFLNDFDFFSSINNLKKKAKYIQISEQLSSPYLILFWLIFELFNIFFNFEGIAFYSLLGAINENKNSINKLFRYIGKIDTAISINSFFTNNKEEICIPVFTKSKKIIAYDIYHPLIKNCVKNNIELNNSSLLLTGSNMSGKTTFIRTIALNSILAQSLGFVFAKKFVIPKNKILTSIRIQDDLFMQKSYFLQEVIRVKEFVDSINESNQFHLFFLDEIFKGTNTIERIASAKSILNYLNNENSIVFVSTHDIELIELLKHKKYNLYHFNESIINNKIVFDYKLKKGPAKEGNALKILELYKFPEIIIKDAQHTKKKLNNKTIPS